MKKEQGLKMLENADDKIVERLSGVPVLGKDEKERMLRMSMKKYNEMAGETSDQMTVNDDVSGEAENEHEVKTVQFRRKPDWIFVLSAAACFAIVTGIFGLRFFRDKGDKNTFYVGNTVTTIAETSEAGISGAAADSEIPADALISETTVSTEVSESLISESSAVQKETVTEKVTEKPVTAAETTVTLPEETKAETTVTDAVVTEKPDPWKEDPEACAEELYRDNIVWMLAESGKRDSSFSFKYSLYDLYKGTSGSDDPNVKELIVYYGTCSADTNGYLYTVRNGEFTRFDKIIGGGHTIFYEDLNDGSLVANESWMGITTLTWYNFEGDELIAVKEEQFDSMEMSTDEFEEKMNSYNFRELTFCGLTDIDNVPNDQLRDMINFDSFR